MSTPSGGEPQQYGGQPQYGQPYGGGPQDGQTQYGQTQYGQTQYGQTQYAQQPYGAGPPPLQRPKNGMGTAALVVGILAVLTCWLPVVGFLFGLLAIIFGVVGRGRAKRGQATNRGVATSGLVLGVLALLVNVVVSVLVAVGAVAFFSHGGGNIVDQAQQCIQQQVASGATAQQARETCQRQLTGQLERQFGGGQGG